MHTQTQHTLLKLSLMHNATRRLSNTLIVTYVPYSDGAVVPTTYYVQAATVRVKQDATGARSVRGLDFAGDLAGIEIEQCYWSMVMRRRHHVEGRMCYDPVGLGLRPTTAVLAGQEGKGVQKLGRGRVEEGQLARLVGQREVGLARLYPATRGWRLTGVRVPHSSQDPAMVVLSLSVDLSSAPNGRLGLSTDSKQHVLVVVMPQVPARLGVPVSGLLAAPLPNAVVPPVKRVAELIDVGDGGQVPQTDYPLAASCEQNTLQLGARVGTRHIGHGEERARVTPQCDVGF